MKTKNIIIWAAVIIILLLVLMWLYRHFGEFNNATVRKLLNDEADKYQDSKSAYKILHNATNSILNDSALTATVRDYAAATGLPKEKVLVDAAMSLSQSLQYLKTS